MQYPDTINHNLTLLKAWAHKENNKWLEEMVFYLSNSNFTSYINSKDKQDTIKICLEWESKLIDCYHNLHNTETKPTWKKIYTWFTQSIDSLKKCYHEKNSPLKWKIKTRAKKNKWLIVSQLFDDGKKDIDRYHYFYVKNSTINVRNQNMKDCFQIYKNGSVEETKSREEEDESDNSENKSSVHNDKIKKEENYQWDLIKNDGNKIKIISDVFPDLPLCQKLEIIKKDNEHDTIIEEKVAHNIEHSGRKRTILNEQNNKKSETRNVLNIINNKLLPKGKTTATIDKFKQNFFSHVINKHIDEKKYSSASLLLSSLTTPRSRSNKLLFPISKPLKVNSTPRVQGNLLNNASNISFETPPEHVFNIATKCDSISSKRSIIKSFGKDEVNNNYNPNLIIQKLMSNDNWFRTRYENRNICNIKEIDPWNSELSTHFKPMSLFDNTNIREYGLDGRKNKEPIRETKINNIKIKGIMTRYEKGKDDLLKLRRSLSNASMELLGRSRNNNKIVGKSTFMAAFNTPKEEMFPIHYLPRSGSGLWDVNGNGG